MWRARGVPPSEIQAVVQRHTAGRMFGLFEEPQANVFELNMDLKERYQKL